MVTSAYCTFYVGDLFVGLKAERVQEFTRNQSVARVPLSPSYVSGLMNLRGQIVTAISLERRFALTEQDEKPAFNVIVRDQEELVGILVDRLGDIVELDENLCELPPITIHQKIRSLLSAVHQREDGLLLILDLERTLEKGG